jgi:Zn-dependent protease
MGPYNIIQLIVISALPALFAITLHEVAHGWVARRLGDPTAQMLGRLTINPLKHIDPIGTIVVPVILLVLHSPFLLGWAKPVPISPRNFKNPRRDMAMVAAAGPLSNFAMGIFWALVVKAAVLLPSSASLRIPLVYMGLAGVFINIALMVFNLIPIPPLDGGRVLIGVLPHNAANALDRVERYGAFIPLLFIILILVIFPGLVDLILGAPINWLSHLLVGDAVS